MKEMSELQRYIESAGYEVKMLPAGVLEVKDPVRVNGKIAYYDTHRLYTPHQARKFINARS